MEKEQNIIQMEKLDMKENIVMINMKDLENIIGKMVDILQENLKME